MNKLNLNPLPEQTEDYSHYQETVIRWDRIVMFLAALGFLLGLGMYALFSENDDGPASQSAHKVSTANMASSAKQANAEFDGESLNGDELKDAKLKDEKLSSQGKIQAKTAAEPSPSVVAQPKTNTKSSIQRSPIKAEQISKQEESSISDAPANHATGTENATDTANLPRLRIVEGEAPDLAPLIVVNSAIEKAVLTQSLLRQGGKREERPGPPLSKQVGMNEEGIIKIILYTIMDNLKGKTLYHEWYRNGVRQARVKIPVNVSTQKSHSSKYINKQMLGNWKVKVVDADGEPYVLADFEVVKDKVVKDKVVTTKD